MMAVIMKSRLTDFVFTTFTALFVIGRPKTPSLHASFERYVEMLETINNSPLLREEWSKHVALTRSDPVSITEIFIIQDSFYSV